MIKKFIHWFNHLTGSNEGKIVTWSDDEFIYVGFECSGCGIIDPSTVDKVELGKILPNK